jgi:hypothetical protein
LLAWSGLAFATGPSHAGTYLRDPQVPVNGTGLQSYFAFVGESIKVLTDQRNFELLHGDSAYTLFGGGVGTTFSFEIELGPHAPGTTLGIYGGHDTVPSLIPIFPDTSGNGWFGVVSYRWSPTRVIVSLFDGAASFKGSRTYLGGDRYGIGFYVATAHATYFSQDARNPSAEPRCLFYLGTGINSGSLWVAWEDGDAPADDDFDDSILFVETGSEGPYFTPTQRTTWGALKARFR